MAALRCTTCGINYPVRGHRICVVCGERCDPVQNEKPHADWKDRVRERREELHQASLPVSSEPVIAVPVTEKEGLLFISSWDVCRTGYSSRLRVDQVIVVNGSRYEVNNYNATRREYWISLLQESQ